MHVQIDPPPHVLEDEIGLKLVAPDDGWRRRPDMDPDATNIFRASIVADVSGVTLAQRYFGGRADGLRPGRSEELLVATT